MAQQTAHQAAHQTAAAKPKPRPTPPAAQIRAALPSSPSQPYATPSCILRSTARLQNPSSTVNTPVPEVSTLFKVDFALNVAVASCPIRQLTTNARSYT